MGFKTMLISKPKKLTFEVDQYLLKKLNLKLTASSEDLQIVYIDHIDLYKIASRFGSFRAMPNEVRRLMRKFCVVKFPDDLLSFKEAYLEAYKAAGSRPPMLPFLKKRYSFSQSQAIKALRGLSSSMSEENEGGSKKDSCPSDGEIKVMFEEIQAVWGYEVNVLKWQVPTPAITGYHLVDFYAFAEKYAAGGGGLNNLALGIGEEVSACKMISKGKHLMQKKMWKRAAFLKKTNVGFFGN